MNLALLKGISAYITGLEKIYFCKRVTDNILLLKIDDVLFYIDLSRGTSGMYCVKEKILGSKIYTAPFDCKLRDLCHHSKLLDCQVDGDNRILCLYFLSNSAYKKQKFSLELEFTGKFTNAILLDDNRVVIEALHHLPNAKRTLQVGKILDKLPQPSNPIPTHTVVVNQYLLYDLYLEHMRVGLSHAKSQALKNIESKIANLEQNLEKLPQEHELEVLAKRFGFYANVLLLHLHTLDPQALYASDVNIKLSSDELEQARDLQIALKDCTIQIPITKDAMSFSSLAQHYFALSKKTRNKAQNIHRQTKNLTDSLEFLDSQKQLIASATTLEDLKIFVPTKSTRNKFAKNKESFEVFFIQDIKIGIGRNSLQNIALLKAAKSEDIWLHLRNIPSSHMIIFCGKSKLDNDILRKAAQILCAFCKLQALSVQVDYTKRKFVKITQGANVVYAKYQTLEYKT